jgi:uncharacterized coiled-coil DUF342 family protein
MESRKYKSLPVANSERIDKIEKQLSEKSENDYEKRIIDLTNQIEELGKRFAEYVSKTDDCSVRLDNHITKVNDIEKQIDDVSEKIESLNFEII